MVERQCGRCGSKIIINGKNVEIITTPVVGYSNITCSDCRKWIVDNTR